MNIIEQKILTRDQKRVIYKLWNREYPENLELKTVADFDSYLNDLAEINHYLLTSNSGIILGWACIFSRDGEKWFSIILDSSIHGQGIGTLLLKRLKEREPALSGWVIDHDNDQRRDGQVYKSPLSFYKKSGFRVCSDIRLELDNISAVKIEWNRS